jgi:hypothetical protein
MRRVPFESSLRTWLATGVTSLLMLATLPIPDGIVRWVVIGVIVVGWVIAMRRLGKPRD